MNDWQLGSHFATSDVVSASEPADSPELILRGLHLESGRQAIGAIAEHLLRAGHRKIRFPTHYCDSMIAPFRNRGWEIDWLEVTPDWNVIPPKAQGTAPVFIPSYFGLDRGAAWDAWALEASQRGTPLVWDATHAVFDAVPTWASFVLSSLRKMLPVADGAPLIGLAPYLQQPSEQGLLRWRAMDAKARALSGASSEEFLPLFATAEKTTETALEPARVSRRSMDVLGQLDYSWLAKRRRANTEAFAHAYRDSRWRLTTARAQVASFHVLEGPGAADLRKYLIAHRAFTPLHWPNPRSYAGPSWRNDLVSIPVDHRYEPEDMYQVIKLIEAYTGR